MATEITAENMRVAFDKIRDQAKEIRALPGIPTGRVVHASPEHDDLMRQRIADLLRSLGVDDETDHAFTEGLTWIHALVQAEFDKDDIGPFVIGAHIGLVTGLMARQLAAEEQDSSAS